MYITKENLGKVGETDYFGALGKVVWLDCWIKLIWKA